VQRLALKATANQPRKVAKARRAEVEAATDAIWAEIMTTIAAWSETP
jgi:hypothetical protein